MSRSIDTIWIVLTPLSAVGLLCVLVARKYTLKRNVVKAGEERPGSDESATAEGKQATTPESGQEPEKMEKQNDDETNNVPTKKDSEV